jgi:RNA polymerase sigma factor (sigma-70 family)
MSAVQPIQPEDLALVTCIIAGDEGAEDQFARQFFERFIYLARRSGVPLRDCQDVAQEAMLAALDQIRRGVFRNEGQFGHWLARIVRGKAMDYWRKQHSPAGATVIPLDEPGEVQDAIEAITSPMSDYELIACVRETLQMLPRQHRVILLLKRTEGFTLEEISRMLEMTMGQVSGKLYAAEEMFRRGLGAERTPAERTARISLPPGDAIARRSRREQPTDHRSPAGPVAGMRRAGNQPAAYGLLLRARQRIGAAISRSAFAGV